ncbi:MAG: type III pantothenate kinase [Bdellovibrionales bacterium]
MLLAIDIGNTNTVFAVFRGDALSNAWRLRSDAARSVDEYAAFLHEMFALNGLAFSAIADVIVSSVVPEANFVITQFCQRYLRHDPVFVTKDMAGIAVDLDRPDEIGADRLVNAVAVKALYQTPAIVVDFGTATTFDVIDANGAYAGGAIAPGINLSIHALHQAASKLPKISIAKPQSAIGKNTVQAMQSGVFWGYVGLVDKLVETLAAELGGDHEPLVIATGGLAPLFAGHTDAIDTLDDDLTLKGLRIIHDQQTQQTQ